MNSAGRGQKEGYGVHPSERISMELLAMHIAVPLFEQLLHPASSGILKWRSIATKLWKLRSLALKFPIDIFQ